jgi:hypothetical protein
MDAKDMLIEQLKAQLQRQAEVFQSQHLATTSQFNEQLQEKDSLIVSLQQQIKRLMMTVLGSRQERINPDQLLLFTEAELQQLANELGKLNVNESADDEPNGESLDDGCGSTGNESGNCTDDKPSGKDKPA